MAVLVPQIAHIRRRRCDAPRVWTLNIEVEKGEKIEFAPGQFNMLTVFGVGEIPVSVSGNPKGRGHLVHTVRDVGPVSGALTRLRVGDVLGLRGPFGSAWPVAEAKGKDVLLMAGGLGLAPLRPALYWLLAERRNYENIILHYGTRMPEDILYRRELEKWRGRLDLQVEVTVDHALPEWEGNVGVVTTLLSRARFDPLKTIAFVCGPEIMMRFAIAALRDTGVDDESIYLSMERNMKCAIGHCGHCQFGPVFVCRDGPVFRYDRLRSLLQVKEL